MPDTRSERIIMSRINSVLQVVFSKKVRIVLLWSALYLLLFNWGLWGGVKTAFAFSTLAVVAMIGLTLFSLKVLIPELLIKRNKTLLYSIASILLIVALTALCVWLEYHLFVMIGYPFKGELRFIYPITKFFALLIVTFTVCNIFYFSRKMEDDADKQQSLQEEKKDLELKVLKTQINSHFLFNALNNIYSMVYFKDQATAMYVLNLSQMMRYVIEDCEADYTTIDKEVEYVDNYIAFQQLRFETARDVRFTKEISDYRLKIPPMVLQPIVENCFKHCPLDLEADSYIHMHLKADEKQLHFSTVNSRSTSKAEPQESRSGIGLTNIRRRLDLLFAEHYSLGIVIAEDSFGVELDINFE